MEFEESSHIDDKENLNFTHVELQIMNIGWWYCAEKKSIILEEGKAIKFQVIGIK